jgi:hypothetical protein
LINKEFSSQDVSLVAYLHSKSHKILRALERDNFNRISFVFAETPQLLTDVYNYTKDEPIPVQTYYRSLSFVWNLIKQSGIKSTPL